MTASANCQFDTNDNKLHKVIAYPVKLTGKAMFGVVRAQKNGPGKIWPKFRAPIDEEED